jgi:hypothetical protein
MKCVAHEIDYLPDLQHPADAEAVHREFRRLDHGFR